MLMSRLEFFEREDMWVLGLGRPRARRTLSVGWSWMEIGVE